MTTTRLKALAPYVEVRVQGIPCIATLQRYTPRVEGKYLGAAEDCFPDDPENVEFNLYDRKGYAADWLWAKMTSKDELAIMDALTPTPELDD